MRNLPRWVLPGIWPSENDGGKDAEAGNSMERVVDAGRRSQRCLQPVKAGMIHRGRFPGDDDVESCDSRRLMTLNPV